MPVTTARAGLLGHSSHFGQRSATLYLAAIGHSSTVDSACRVRAANRIRILVFHYISSRTFATNGSRMYKYLSVHEFSVIVVYWTSELPIWNSVFDRVLSLSWVRSVFELIVCKFSRQVFGNSEFIIDHSVVIIGQWVIFKTSSRGGLASDWVIAELVFV